jgi:adenosylmethionine-8-amino-7-oxononanoate aminotransferase
MHYTSADGRRILGGTSGLWCVNAGHGRMEITQAVERQLPALDYALSFQMGHPLAFEFAGRLAAIAPGSGEGKLDRIFFTNSGSEAVDTALTIAVAYHRTGHQHPPLARSPAHLRIPRSAGRRLLGALLDPVSCRVELIVDVGHD